MKPTITVSKIRAINNANKPNTRASIQLTIEGVCKLDNFLLVEYPDGFKLREPRLYFKDKYSRPTAYFINSELRNEVLQLAIDAYKALPSN